MPKKPITKREIRSIAAEVLQARGNDEEVRRLVEALVSSFGDTRSGEVIAAELRALLADGMPLTEIFADVSDSSAVNQQVLADRLGLSRATISRCFTNHSAIHPSTRSRVFDLAAELGYRYLEARTPTDRDRTNQTIGVLICHRGTFAEEDRFENPGQKLLDGVSQMAQVRGVQLDVHYVNPEEMRLDDPSYMTIVGLHRQRWRGALLIYRFPPEILDGLVAKFPCVSLVEQYGRSDLNCVDVDHFRGISKVADRLINHGHRRIGFYSAQANMSWAIRRFSAYFEKLATLGLPFRPEDAINVLPTDQRSEEDALEKMLAQTADGVTAWVCASDYAAYSVIAHLGTNKFSVPDMVSVTGFDGIYPPEGALSAATLAVPYREIGLTGARRLLDLTKSPFEPAQQILLDCQLRRGESVGSREPHRAEKTNHQT